jgi:hypothetical protein
MMQHREESMKQMPAAEQGRFVAAVARLADQIPMQVQSVWTRHAAPPRPVPVGVPGQVTE